MPLGENVGTAYVKILADGNGLADGIKDELDDTEGVFEEAGKRDAEAYDDEFRKQLKRDRPGTQKEVAERMRVSSQRIRQLTEEFSTTYFKNIETSVKKEYGQTLGSRMIDDIRKGFLTGGGYKAFGKDMEDLFAKLPEYAEKANAAIREESERTTKALRRAGKEQEAALEDTRRGGGRFILTMRRIGDSVDNVAPSIGRAFGKGSRNDFINFFGGIVEGSTRLIGLVPKVIDKVGSLSGTFFSALKAGEGFGGALKALSSGAGGLSMFARLGPIAAAGLAVLVLVLPVVASLVALLGGAITALAGSITFALIGALGAVAGAFLPVIAGVSVLTAGILAMSDAQKAALKDALRPLGNEFKRLGRIGAGAIFRDAAEQAERLTTGLKSAGLERLVLRIGNAIRHIGDDWVDAIDSPGFRRFIKEMGDSLPGQLEKVGRVARQTIGGIGGIFIGLQPITDRFLTYLDRITAKFSAFANSEAGQEKIVSFFERAGDSAASLGELLDNVGEALGELFTAGQETGDTIIDQLAAKVQEFVDYLNANPDAVSGFFKQAGEFASSLGGAVEGIIKTFAALDSATSRSSVIDVFNKLGAAMKFIGTTGAVVEDAFLLVKGALEFIFLPISTLIGLFQNGIPGAIAVVINTFADFVDGLSLVGKAIDLLPGVDGFSDKIDGLADSMRGFADDLIGVKDATSTPIDVKINSDGVKGAGESARNAKNDLQGFRDLLLAPLDPPPVKPKVELSSLKGGVEVGKELERGLRNLVSFPGVKVKVDSLQASAARLKTLEAQRQYEEFAGVSSKGTTIKINAESANVAKGLVDRLKESLNLIPRNVTTTITTRRKTAGDPGGNIPVNGATGGIMDDGAFHRLKNFASGGFANFAQRYRIGEAGREAIVPLDRPLGQVDPAVRAIAAFAQGKLGSYGQGGGGGKTVDASGWTIVSNSEDPRRVADEAVNELAGAVF